MHLTRLCLTDFRSYEELDLVLDQGTTVLVGKNGAGKTNIVEAAHYLGTMSSHRVALDTPLVRTGAAHAVVRGRVARAGRTVSIDLTLVPGKANSVRVNGSAVRARDAVGLLRTVVFSPEDIDLVRGDPAGRRRFIDELGVALAPVLAGDLADYDRVIRHKGALLKSLRSRGKSDSSLDVWNEKLASVGARILCARIGALDALAPHVAEAYAALAPGEKRLNLAYGNDRAVDTFRRGGEEAVCEFLTSEMGAEAEREIERGVCLVGPHRDDLVLELGDLPVKGYGSHGESWATALSLRLGTYDLLTAAGGPDGGEEGEPVLILDDVFAELDETRRLALAHRAHLARQVLVTAAVRDDVPALLGGRTFTVGGGRAVADD